MLTSVDAFNRKRLSWQTFLRLRWYTWLFCKKPNTGKIWISILQDIQHILVNVQIAAVSSLISAMTLMVMSHTFQEHIPQMYKRLPFGMLKSNTPFFISIIPQKKISTCQTFRIQFIIIPSWLVILMDSLCSGVIQIIIELGISLKRSVDQQI